jgi:polar amino acid transport system substrate-binding protein
MRRFWLFLSVACLFSILPAAAQAGQTLTLTSLEWPPYTGGSLKNMGASAAVVTEAFKSMGYELKIEFFPWDRAVALANSDQRVMGYFPEYYSALNSKAFIYSDPIGSGPLGFVERRDAPIKWSTLDDLKGLTIGVVDGYLNTEQFDSMVAAKQLKVDAAQNDATNLVKVANRRFPAAVIDQNVLRYLLNIDKDSQPYSSVLGFNARPLEVKKLYVCFKANAEGEKYAKILAEGLKKINAEKIMQDYFAALMGK